MTKKQLKIAKMMNKSAFKVTNGDDVRYTVNTSLNQVKSRFTGDWIIEKISWDEFEKNYKFELFISYFFEKVIYKKIMIIKKFFISKKSYIFA